MSKQSFKSFEELNNAIKPQAKVNTNTSISSSEPLTGCSPRYGDLSTEEKVRRFNEYKQARIQAELKQRAKEDERFMLELKEKRMREFQQRRNELKPLLDKRGINCLLHFTRIENLSSILSNGILPKSTLRNRNIDYINNDEKRFDFKTDCVCVSIEYPNQWVLKSYKENSPNSKWVIIDLNPELLFEQTNYYAKHNAATQSIARDLEYCTKASDFEAMFTDSIDVTYSNGTTRTYYRKLAGARFPTSDQAEILVQGPINTKYIDSIIFYDDNDAKNYRAELEHLNIDCFTNTIIFDYPRRNVKLE